MIHLKVEQVLRIDAKFSWVEWCLLDIPGKIDLAVDLNWRLMKAINEYDAPDRDSVRLEIEGLIDTNLQFIDEHSGDFESFLDTVLDEIFGEE